ncbi:MAG: arginine--tRNA ligase [bacterium]
MEERIRKAVADKLAELGTVETAFAVEWPADLSHGDFAVNAAMAAAKKFGKNPKEIAEEIAEALRAALGSDASRVEVAGPGFVNVTLSRGAVTEAVYRALAAGDRWGKGVEEIGKRVIIEYSVPNPFKEMHLGHLVGTVVGESLSRLIENAGATVARDTFGGDVGPNVAKALWGLRKRGITEPTTAKEIGEAYIEGSRAYEDEPRAQAEIDALNQAIYAGTDRELMELWRKGREVSMKEFRRIWQLLGTRFDFEFFDSDTTQLGIKIVHEGLKKGIFEESDGAIIYNGENKGVHTMVFITSHDTPTYEAKDIGFAFLKEERWPSDKVIILTGNEQTGRFKTVLAALSEIAPELARKMVHVATGFLRLTAGKMSSREGNVITADAFLRDVTEKVFEKNEDPFVANEVAVGAIKYMILRQVPGSDIIFDKEKSLSLEGDSGPYLQYALVRAKSIIAKVGTAATGDAPAEPYVIERLLMRFPSIVTRAASALAPNQVVTYLTELASAWNAFYAKEQIIGGEHEAYKLEVARVFEKTMERGLWLLGIKAPERM